ncbi:hypothetical protein G9O61_00g015050, partial [Vairimorpha ceranae]
PVLARVLYDDDESTNNDNQNYKAFLMGYKFYNKCEWHQIYDSCFLGVVGFFNEGSMQNFVRMQPDSIIRRKK